MDNYSFSDPSSTPNSANAADAMNIGAKPLGWLADGTLSEGVSLMDCSQELSKSWFCFNLSVPVATGGEDKESLEASSAANDNDPVYGSSKSSLSLDDSEGE
jgi:hypothetical protein